MTRMFAKFTYANVVATLALFLALVGGTAFAASKMLPKNSVGAKQLQPGAVTPAKLSGASKATLSGPAGPQGPTGAQGPQGAKGEPGEKGDRGEPGPFPQTLPKGASISGFIEPAGSGATIAAASASFDFPLATAPTVHYVKSGEPTPSGCTGDKTNPGAESGNLCVFELQTYNVTTRSVTSGAGDGTSDKRGFALFAIGVEPGLFLVQARWVVTG